MTATETEATMETVRVSAPGVYGEIVDFLIDEAALLDHDRQLEWYELLTADVRYQMPVRETLYREYGDGFTTDYHFDDDAKSLRVRVKRNVEIASAYDRDPAPRLRRMVSNVVVRHADGSDDYEVTSSILVLRSRFDQVDFDMISGERRDVIRRTPDGLRLARRTVLLDQSRLGSPWPNVLM